MRIFGFDIKRAPRATYDIRKINRIQLADGDVMVVHCDAPLSAQQAESVKQVIMDAFGSEREVIVFDSGVRLSVVSIGAVKHASTSE